MKRIEKAPVVVMDFSGAYEWEEFAANSHFVHINCEDIQGTKCILSREACREINRRIGRFGARGIHFIDSGDYHYMTKLWTDKIHEPFTLILVDHHTDMQPSQVPEIITCGDWVNSVIDGNKYLKQIILLGMPRKSIEQIPQRYRKHVDYIDKPQFMEILSGRLSLNIMGKAYLSIDKDVLNEQNAVTNWDQGQATVAELQQFVSLLLEKEKVMGIDVCGEFPVMKSLFDEEKAAEVDDMANEALLDVVEKQVLHKERASTGPTLSLSTAR